MENIICPHSGAVVWSPAEDLSRLLSDFEEQDSLGFGGYGGVMSALNKLDKQIYAIKKVKLDKSIGGFNYAIREVIVMASLCHPNVVRYHSCWLEKKPDKNGPVPMLCIQQELCYGTLNDKPMKEPIGKERIWSWFRQIDYIHSMNICH